MNHSPGKNMFMRARTYFILIALVIVIMNTIFLLRENKRIQMANEELGLEVAQTLFDSILVTREWNAMHQGVYVPVSEHIQPNPYLKNPGRDVVTTDGTQLTKINPAYMTRLISELMEDNSDMSYNITSLEPLNPNNAPDSWEQQALKAFHEGKTSHYTYENNTTETTSLRYMEPLLVEESCLSCHGYQGYQVGDVRGGISVTLPYLPFQTNIAESTQSNVWAYGSMSGLMLVFLFAIAKMYERKEQQLIIMREKALEASEAKSRFLASMNHEIRTPLNGIAGFLRLLQTTDLTAHQKEYIQQMEQSSHHLLGLVSNVLDMARIEAGEISLDKEAIHLHEEMKTALAPLRALAQEKGIGLHLHIRENTPTYVVGDAGRIRQVIVNLVGNAVKFTEKGSVSLAVEPVDLQQEQHVISFTVQDTGPGITQESIDKLFKPFYQERNGLKNHLGGTGLGMAITKEFVELMEGNIQVSSQIGQGTKVVVELPLEAAHDIGKQPAATTVEERTPNSTPQYSPQHILVVDDQQINIKLMQRLFQHLNLSCDVAENGVEAVEACHQKDYDLILMDVNMPVMDGFEATKRIRELNSPHQPKIVAMTASATDEDKEKCLEAGMDLYLTKPIEFSKIEGLINPSSSKNTVNKDQNNDQEAAEENDQLSSVKDLIEEGIQRLERKAGFEKHQAMEILRDAVDHWHQMIPETEEALAEEQMETVKKNLHKLKGSFATMQMEALSTLAAQAETFAHNGDKDQTANHLRSIKTIVNDMIDHENPRTF